jgi:hypothetical protein
VWLRSLVLKSRCEPVQWLSSFSNVKQITNLPHISRKFVLRQRSLLLYLYTLVDKEFLLVLDSTLEPKMAAETTLKKGANGPVAGSHDLIVICRNINL